MKTIAALLLALAFWSAGALAEVEVIALQHRTAEEIVPALQPHLEQGGRLSHFGNRLIIDTSPANLAKLKRILSAIDRPLRQLLIRLRLEDAAERDGGKAWGTRELREGRGVQEVRVVEGGTAYIQAGVSVPVALRQVVVGPAGAVLSESVVYRDLGSGFTARPTLAGDTVTLEIGPRQETPLRDPRGAVQVQRLSTTVSGRLGEWIPLGGTDLALEAEGAVTYSTRDLRRQGRLLLMVEEVR